MTAFLPSHHEEEPAAPTRHPPSSSSPSPSTSPATARTPLSAHSALHHSRPSSATLGGCATEAEAVCNTLLALRTASPAHGPAGHGKDEHTGGRSSTQTGADVDVEKQGAPGKEEGDKDGRERGQAASGVAFDIEHVPVQDDPREWSSARKWATVAMCSYGALIPTCAGNIIFPALAQMKQDLHTTDSALALTVSLFILFQGVIPLLWSAISEIFGRKRCYIASTAIFTVASGVASAGKNIGTILAMRLLQASGSSALMSIGAGTLADIYDVNQRGEKLGIYYAAPLLGPALGPVLGGVLTEASSWRATFYFIVAAGFGSFVSFCFFKDTFRPARSLAWQAARKRALAKALEEEEKERRKRDEEMVRRMTVGDEGKVESGGGRGEKEDSEFPSPSSHLPAPVPTYMEAPTDKLAADGSEAAPSSTEAGAKSTAPGVSGVLARSLSKVRSKGETAGLDRVVTAGGTEQKVKLTLADVSPLAAALPVLSRPHNLLTLLFSGSLFASQYSLSYTVSRTLEGPHYRFSPLQTGLVLLSLGVGSLIGSVGGGRYSDIVLQRLKAKNGGVSEPEMRIRSTLIALAFLPPAFVGYAWVVEEHVHVSAICVFLFVVGMLQIWIYSSTLAYTVDSNQGRSTSAVACNSCLRGVSAFIAAEVAGPLQDSVGDGALYTGWAIIIAAGEVCLLIVMWKGKRWRQPEWKWPRPRLCLPWFQGKRREVRPVAEKGV